MTIAIFHGMLIEAHKVTNISPDDIMGTARSGKVTTVRQAVQYAMRQRSEWSLPMIGKAFRRDHSTVCYGIERITKRLANDGDMEFLIHRLMQAPIVPFDEFERYMAQVRDPSVIRPERKPLMLKPVARNVQSPLSSKPPEKWLDGFQKSRLKYFTSIDEDGHCFGERYMEFNMRRGSEMLRRALVMARAA